MPLGKVKIYGCGGSGVNLARLAKGTFTKENPLTGDVAVSYGFIDTSYSNGLNELPADEVFVVNDEKEGSGGIRGTNAKLVNSCIKEVLGKLAPEEFNIVLCSTTGGSGSVIAPILVRELHRRGLVGVVVCVGDDKSFISVSNTENTVKTFESMVSLTDVPIALAYSHHSGDTPRSLVDRDVISNITSLLLLFSSKNTEVDTSDVVNFFYWNRYTKGEASLAILDIGSGKNHHAITNTDATPLISMAIMANPDQPLVRLNTVSHKTGYRDLSKYDISEIYYTLSPHRVEDLGKTVQNNVKDQSSRLDARRPAAKLLKVGEADDDTGLVGV